MSSQVETNLRNQREAWREISERIAATAGREFPVQPKRILLFGVGSSYFAARLTAYALIRDGSRGRVPVVACPSGAIGVEIQPQKGDWAFAFSHRASNAPTLNAIEICNRNNAFTVLVCGKGATVPEGVKQVLETVEQETIEPHTLSMTGAICAATTVLLGARGIEEWDALRSIGDPDLEAFKRRAGQGPNIILGEWEGEWLAREGALKLMEMARLPVRAFGSEEYFHGPRFSLQKDDVIWHVSVPKDPRNADIKAGHVIGVFGKSPLAWIPALVELQWLALAVAINRGVNPDDPTAG